MTPGGRMVSGQLWVVCKEQHDDNARNWFRVVSVHGRTAIILWEGKEKQEVDNFDSSFWSRDYYLSEADQVKSILNNYDT